MRGFTLWLTGPSPALAASVARRVEEALLERGMAVEFVGGDEVRERLGAGPGDPAEARAACARRVGFVCRLLSRNGVAAIAAEPLAPAPLRDELRAAIERLVEVELRGSAEATAGTADAPGSGPESERTHVVSVAGEGGEDGAVRAIVSLLEALGHVPGIGGGGYLAEEEEAIKARLRDLGYI
ncbi:MAG: adenylyl-sulfate kinase [Candidatus Eisenbacteria bacterium]|nr:adenylyl-sulfate kinase [Candidatus Eisenbacteria bacterium]